MPDLRLNSYGVLWNRIAEGAFGIGSRVTLEKTDKKTYTMKTITRDGKEYSLGWTGETDWLIAEYLGVRKPGIKSWTFIIDIDTLTMQRFGITSRDALYTKDVSRLATYPYSEISVGRTIEDRASDVPRGMGYTEFIGPTIYEPGVYKKMNMFQDEWDTNNKGVPLTRQDAQNDALRTVLAPSLEQALSENWQAGNQSVKIFEIGHIFLPKGKHDKDKTPYEKTALSVGAYGPDMNYEVFTEEVINILKGLGVNIPYFVESEGAIAYHPKECSLIMNRMGGYLFGNFGQISVKAQKNYGIGVPAYMAQLELQPLEAERIAEFQKNPEDK